MKTLLDTSVLVPALVRGLPQHSRAQPWLERARSGEFSWAVASHTLAELYAVLTALPVSPRIMPATARRLIRENVEDSAEIVALSPRDYRDVLTMMADLGLSSGAVYDALICRAAQKAEARRVLTFNIAHFRRVWPEGGSIIQAP
jgi:predicted nucleic acid-binding protein